MENLLQEFGVVGIGVYLAAKDYLQYRAKKLFEKEATREDRRLAVTPEAPVIAAKIQEVSRDLKEVVKQTTETNGRLKVVEQKVVDHEKLDDKREGHILESIGVFRGELKTLRDDMKTLWGKFTGTT